MSENGNGTAAGELDTKALKTKIQAILKDADLETTSAKKVRTQLEEDLGGKDLSDRKEEINNIIKEVMDEMEDDEEEEEDDEEEEEAASEEEEDGSDEDYSEEEKPKKKSPAKRSPAAAPKRSPVASAKRATPKKSYAESEDSEAQEKSDDPSDDDEEEESEDDSDGARRPNKGRAKPVAGVVRGKKKKDEDAHSSDFSVGSEDGESSDGGGDSDYAPDAMASSLKKKAKAKAKAGRGRGRGRGRKRKANSDDSSDDSSGEEWGKKKKSTAKKRKNAYSDDSDADSDASSKPKKKRGGGGGGGFTKPQNLSEELADIVGKDVAPRHEVVKQVWAYIKENKLQDPKNKQFAKCDDKLMKVIGVKKFRCFGMAKFLKDHMTPT